MDDLNTNTYAITIKEILRKTILVRDTNISNAIERVENAYINGHIVLDGGDCDDVDIEPDSEPDSHWNYEFL